MGPTPDVSVSLGLDYAAFTAQANAASSKTVEQVIKNLSLHMKQASVIAGTGAARATAFSGFFGSLVAPIARPFNETRDAMQATAQSAVVAASHISRTFQKEFGANGPVDKAWQRVGFQIAVTARFAQRQWRHAAADMRGAFVGAGITLARTMPQQFAQVMRSFPSLNRYLHGKLVNFGSGPGVFAPLRELIRKPLIAGTVAFANAFPSLFARAMRSVPALDKFLHGKLTAGLGPTLFTPLLNALRRPIVAAGVYLANTFPVQFGRALRSFPAVDKFLHGRLTAGLAGGGLAVGLVNALRRPIVAAGVFFANTFPAAFAKSLRSFPALDKFLHGKLTAGLGPGLFTPLRNAFRKPILGAMIGLENTMPQLFARLLRSFPPLDKFLHGRLTATAGPGLFGKFAAPFLKIKDALGKTFASLEPFFRQFAQAAKTVAGFGAAIGKTLLATGRVVGVLALAVGQTLVSAFKVVGAVASSVLNVLGTALHGIFNIITSVAKSLFLLGTGAAVIFTIAIAKAMNYGKELDALARRSGFTAAQIETMRLATYRSGQTAASVTAIMAHMRESLTFGEATQAMQVLGLNVERLRRVAASDPAAAFAEIAETVNRITNPIQRARVATALLGEAGAAAIAQFQKGDNQFGPAIRQYLADLAGGTAGMQIVADHWTRIKLASSVFLNTIAAKVAPALSQIASWLENRLLPRAQQVGERLGNAIAAALETALELTDAIATGAITVGELLKASFKVALFWFINQGASLMYLLGKILYQALREAFKLMAQPQILTGVVHLFLGIGRLLANALLEFVRLIPSATKVLYLAMLDALSPLHTELATFFTNLAAGWKEHQLRGLMEQDSTRTGLAKVTEYEDLKREQTALRQRADKARQAGDITGAAELSNAAEKLRPKLQEYGKEAAVAMADESVRRAHALMTEIETLRHTPVKTAQGNGELDAAVNDFAAKATGLTGRLLAGADTQFKKAGADFAKVDLSGFVALAQKLPQMAQQSQVNVVDLKGALAQLQAIIDKRVNIEPGATNYSPMPGKQGPAINQQVVQTRFDEWRRVGGGLGTAATSAMSVAEKSLSVQEKIRDIQQRQLDLWRAGTRGNTGVAGNFRMLTAGAGGY